uniref:Ribonucleoside-diphosphate reductase n=1 Tax=Marseillevirus LCMAC101 TaxID=2506602 RepID=A0A481YRD5_9VIRU|nr:MAG: ribonucleoside diphosphate reductase, large subunit [Marseillevirus LCMAC101]
MALVDNLLKLTTGLEGVDVSTLHRSIEYVRTLSIPNQYSQLANLCQDNTIIHPDWGTFAGRIKIHEIKSMVPATFSESTARLRLTLNEKYANFVADHAKELDRIVCEERDWRFTIFAVETLLKSYLARITQDGKVSILETPQYMWLRVAIFIWFPNMERIEKTYTDLSLGNYVHASPTIFNCGMYRHQLSSCFTAGTKVYTTNRGPISIEDVEIGDEVVTHKGNTKKVTQFHKNLVGERKMYKIKITKTPEIEVTGNHRFWSIQKIGDGEPRWVPIEYLWPGDLIAVPPRNTDTKTFTIDVTEKIPDKYEYDQKDGFIHPLTVWKQKDHLNGTDNDIIRHRKNTSIRKTWKADKDWAFFVGAWYGDGNIMTGKYKEESSTKGIRFTVHNVNKKLIDKIVSIGEEKTGLVARTNPGAGVNENIIWIDFHSGVLGYYFEQHYGKGFRGKKLDSRMYSWGGNEIYGFICGLFSTDGCWTKDHALMLQMSNPEFMTSLYYLFRANGLEVGCNFIHRSKRKGATADMANMYLPKGYLDPQDVCKFYDDDRLLVNKTFVLNSRTKEAGNQRFIRLDSKIEIDNRPKHVYTLGVEDDHSYCVEGVVAENCFLLTVGDNMQSITKSWSDCAMISMGMGGIGINHGYLRHSQVGHFGDTQGIVPWTRILNNILKAVNQGTRRPGSGAVYLPPWHIDIEEFLELKLSAGAEDMRARDLFYALWVSDEFMRRVENDEMWTLMCPNKAKGLNDKWGKEFEMAYKTYEEKFKDGKLFNCRQVRARDLMHKICLTQIETGMPYILFKDACNRKSNQKNLGTICCSNLCVSSDTQILTDQGYFQIEELKDEEVNIWNGEDWSPVTVKQTGTNQDLLTVELSNGVSINCTPYHKFNLQKSYGSTEPLEMVAKNLPLGGKLIKWNLPEPIKIKNPAEFKYPYTHGFFCGDGTTYDNYSKTKRYPKVYLYGPEKRKLLKYLQHDSVTESSGRLNVTLPKDMAAKFDVPMNTDITTRLTWLAGYVDADGTIARNDTNESLQISCIHKHFLLKVRLMLHTLGIESKVTISRDKRQAKLPDGKGGEKEYTCQALWRLLISSSGLYKLSQLGFSPYRLKYTPREPQRCAEQFVKVVSVTDDPKCEDTFCFTEHKRHMGMFNGILTGQCVEVIEFTDEKNISSCNLSSIALNSCVTDKTYNFDKLERLTRDSVQNLNQVIDRNFYPPEVPEIKETNLRTRPLGIGVQGLADTFALMDLAWEDEKARKLNSNIFETMYYSAVSESVELAKKDGKYGDFDGSPASKGLLQFDLWNQEKAEKQFDERARDKPNIDINFLRNIEQFQSDRYNWQDMREQVKRYGMRNSLLLALMPTASVAHILGNTECFEPPTQLIYARTVNAGQFVLNNKHMVRDLQDIGMWTTDVVRHIISDKGSLQSVSEDICSKEHLQRFRFLKKKYKTAFELSQKYLLDLAIDRGKFICQSQSFNCWMKDPTYKKLNAYHFHAWKNGAKTGMYYLRQTAKTDPINFSLNTINIPSKKGKTVACTEDECIACQ